MFRFFRHHVALGKIDPLGGGLREMIEAERAEPEAIRLDEDITGHALSEHWGAIVSEVRKESDWFSFANEE